MYPGLQNIFDVPEKDLPEGGLNFDGMTNIEKIDKMGYVSALAVEDRRLYIRNIQQKNKEYRYGLLLANDDNMQNILKERCRRDVLFYINSFVWTYNPRLDHPNIPFITYPFQDDFILDIVESIEIGIDHWVEKSRDMGFSRTLLAIFSRGFLFKGRASLIGSYKQDYVDEQGNMDSAFERLRFIVNKLPFRLKPNDLIIKFMSIGSKELQAEISGDAGGAFGTGGRRKVVLLDEFALWQYDKTALRKTKDLTRCRIFGGTPEGTSNVYGRVMTSHKDYKHLVIKKTRLHRTAHPLKTQIRYELEKMTRTSLDLAKELDISYKGSVTGAVYPLFSRQVKVGKYVYDSNRKTYTSQDFGLDTNACLIIQKDFQTNSLYLITAFSRIDREIGKFAGLVLGLPTQGQEYNEDDLMIMDLTRHYKYANHFGDPYNTDNRSTVNKHSTIRTECSKLGLHLYTDRSMDLQERIKSAYLSFDRLYIDESCQEFFEAMVQSHYPQVKDNVEITAEKTKPVHDENSHYRTAYEYFSSNEPKTDPRFSQGISTNYAGQLS